MDLQVLNSMLGVLILLGIKILWPSISLLPSNLGEAARYVALGIGLVAIDVLLVVTNFVGLFSPVAMPTLVDVLLLRSMQGGLGFVVAGYIVVLLGILGLVWWTVSRISDRE